MVPKHGRIGIPLMYMLTWGLDLDMFTRIISLEITGYQALYSPQNIYIEHQAQSFESSGTIM